MEVVVVVIAGMNSIAVARGLFFSPRRYRHAIGKAPRRNLGLIVVTRGEGSRRDIIVNA